MLAIALAAALGQSPATAVYPQPLHEAPAADYLSWSGFGFLPQNGRVVQDRIPVAGDWSEVQAAIATNNPTPVEWPVRFFVIKRIDRVNKLPDGTLYEEQCALETVDVDRINRAVALLQATVNAETGGAVKVIPQLTVDTEPLRLGNRTLDQALADYVTPRANGGRYTAEDKVYRGPYGAVFVLHPIPTPAPAPSVVNGMPLESVSVYGFPGYEAEGELALQLTKQWTESLQFWARGNGLRGPLASVPLLSTLTNLPNPLVYVPNGDWTALLKGPDLSASEIDARLQLEFLSGQPFANVTTIAKKIHGFGYKGTTCTSTIETDPVQGSILVYKEKGQARDGGLEFPSATGTAIDPSKTKTLSFWVKSNSPDPMALELQSPDGKTFDVSLGGDLSGSKPIYPANLDRDGNWHQVKLDLTKSGLMSISELRLMPTPNAYEHHKTTLGPIEYDFASFEVNNETPDGPWQEPTPDPDSTDAWRRARWANSAHPSPQLLKLLKDPDWFVRLNAIQRYLAEPDSTAEPALAENATLSIDGPASAAAIDALWKLGTPTAKATIHQVLLTGVTEQGKGEAARLLGGTKDPTQAAELIPLQQSRGLITRMAVVDSLGEIPGENAAYIRMTFLYQEDPELKLEVTKTSDPDDTYQWKKLLWSSVNEESDAVRLISYEKLSQSKDPTAKTGGYAGVKDDSVQVRIEFLKFLKQHPTEDNRNALRQAVTDRSARVRAASIEAFSVLEKGVTSDELGAALQDGHPVVQLALIELQKSKKLTLPSATLSQISASHDPDVRAALQTLASS